MHLNHPIPDGLQQRVLQAVHEAQQREIVRWYRIRWASSVALGLTLVTSLGFMAYRLGTTGTSALLETIVMNHDVISVQDSFFALLESLPLGSITLALTAITAFFLIRSFRTSLHPLHV